MGVAEDFLGCPLQMITRSWWAVRLNTGEWVCEARVKTDVYKGIERHFDWSNDLVACGDVNRITQLWLFCPPSKTSPFGNTAHLDITEPGTAFQFKVAMADSNIAMTSRSLQAHIIGKVTNKETGECDAFIWDDVQQGLCTPETEIYDPHSPQTNFRRVDASGRLCTAGKTSVYDFHSWREGIAKLGRLELRTLGVRL